MERTNTQSVVRKARLSAFLLLIPLLAVSCGTPPAVKPQVKDGNVYGLTQGAFRERWWQFYQRGLSFAEGHFWQQAEGDLRAALELRDQDRRRKKTYGMHFLDYFPHRELGVVLFQQGRHEEAVQHLEWSLATEKSAKAEFYLDCARKSLILKEARDRTPPLLLLHAPAAGLVTNRLAVSVVGLARDDTYVQHVAVNDVPVRIDLAAAEVPFRIDVPLREGENILYLEAKDLTGQTSVLQRKVSADWQGPTVTLDEPATLAASQTRTRKPRVAITDDGGIQEIKVNGRMFSYAGQREVFLDVPASPLESGTSFVIEATDRAGNRTRAELPQGHQAVGRRQPVLLASLSLSGLILGGNTSVPAGVSPPLIEVKNWTEQQEVQVDQVYLDGTVSASASVLTLTLNGRPLLRKPSRYVSYSYLAKLEEGSNTLTIQACDEGGRCAEKKLCFVRQLPKVRRLGSRLRVALLPFERNGEPSTVSRLVEEKVLGALLDRRRFDVVERRRLDEVLRELKLSRSEAADAASTLRVGRILAAGGLLLGSLSARETAVEIDLRLVDVETSLVITSVDVYGEDVDAPKLRELCQGLVLKLCDELPVVEGTVLDVSRASAMTDLGHAHKVKQGMRCILFQEGEPILHPLSGTVVGVRTEPLAHGTVRSVLEQTSELELIERDAESRVKPLHRVITQ
jgi:hypothetical protein